MRKSKDRQIVKLSLPTSQQDFGKKVFSVLILNNHALTVIQSTVFTKMLNAW